MQLSTSTRVLVFLVAVLALGLAAGCKKRTQPITRAPVSEPDRPSPEPAAVAAPEIQISASPTTLRRGEEATLTWSSRNADTVVIDAGVGNVAASGSVGVSPLESTTFTATARNRGGEARASARVTVVRDEPTGPVTETDIQALQRAIDEGLIKPVFFAYDRAELSTESQSTLEENARWFRRYPGADIIIEGHCDERGTEEYNLALGDRRAQAAKEYLVQLGISPGRLQTISYGEERPFVQGSSEAAWSQNRRAHFVVR
jgi:peptidoglycan-associated lipoprotein